MVLSEKEIRKLRQLLQSQLDDRTYAQDDPTAYTLRVQIDIVDYILEECE